MTEKDARHISLISPEERAAKGISIRNWRKYRPTIEQTRRYSRLPEPTRPEPGGCEICGADSGPRFRHLALDHDHETGAFRGWLCNRCNVAIGALGDTLEALERVVAYLRRSKQ